MPTKLLAARVEVEKRSSRRLKKSKLYTDFEGTTIDGSGKTTLIRHKAIGVSRRQTDGGWKLIMGDPKWTRMKRPNKRKNKVSEEGVRRSAIPVAEGQANAEAEIRRLINDRIAAVRAKDVNRATSNVAHDVVAFDVVDAFQQVGIEAMRERAASWFSSFEKRHWSRGARPHCWRKWRHRFCAQPESLLWQT